jgi:hypothetical protein
MTGPTLTTACDYARHIGPIFPCGPHKRPLVKDNLNVATRDETQICEWWIDNPDALIGMPTGPASGMVVLDVDVKNGIWGFDTLAELGFAILPDTPMVHTPSGGLHVYFRAPEKELRNTVGKRGRGIGPGLDWRGAGGYVILPGPGGYRWDPRHNLCTEPLAEVPLELLPRVCARESSSEPIQPTSGLSPYAERALEDACRRIIVAPAGEQEATLNAQAWAIGTLAGAGQIPTFFAKRALLWAARQIPNHDLRRPWRVTEIERKVERAFTHGMHRPRQASHA